MKANLSLRSSLESLFGLGLGLIQVWETGWNCVMDNPDMEKIVKKAESNQKGKTSQRSGTSRLIICF